MDSPNGSVAARPQSVVDAGRGGLPHALSRGMHDAVIDVARFKLIGRRSAVSINVVSTQSHGVRDPCAHAERDRHTEEPVLANVIGLDTATADTAVAAMAGGQVVWEATVPPASGTSRPAHATALLGQLERAAAELGGWGEVERLAVGVGPGSFTGLRIGVAAARGLAQALGLEVVPVRTVDALAAGIAATTEGQGRRCLAVLDARRGEIYAGLFDAQGAVEWELFPVSPEALSDRVAALDPAPLAGGDGSIRFRAILKGSGATMLDADDPANRVSARQVCRLGMAADPVPATDLEPIYIRRPDAELWREQQQRRRHEGA